MTTTPPTIEPQEIRAGDTVKWARSLPLYTPADGWTLAYAMNSRSWKGSAAATDNGNGVHLVTLAATLTANIPEGRLAYVGRVSKADEIYTVAHGEFAVLPDLSADRFVDSRTIDEQLLEAVEGALLGSADDDQLSMSVDGVSISVMDKGDLLTVRSRLQRMVRQQRQAEKLRRGVGIGGTIRVRI